MSFKPFGSVKVEWPGKADGRHLHHPPKGDVKLTIKLGTVTKTCMFHLDLDVNAKKIDLKWRVN